MTAPTMARSPEQRAEALEKANHVRGYRHRVKVMAQRGELDVIDLVEFPPDEVLSMSAFDLLRAQRKWGKAKARRLLLMTDCSHSKTVGGLSDRQRAALVAVGRSLPVQGREWPEGVDGGQA